MQEKSQYFALSQLKTQNKIWLTWFNFSWLDLQNLDDSNLKLLWKSITWAIENILNNNEYSYKDFYNLWNLYLLKSFFEFKDKNWSYVKNAQQSISYYYNAIDSTPSQNNKSFILNNLQIAKNFLDIIYNYDCNDLFFKMFEKLKILISIFPEIFETLKQQHLALEQRSQDDDLKNCVQIFQNSSQLNASLILQNQDFYKKVQNWLEKLWKQASEDANLCYQQTPLLKEKYQESISWSLIYFQNFNKSQKDLLTVFSKWEKKDMLYLCQNLDKMQQNQNKANQNMQQNLNNLQDLTEPQKDQKEEKKKKEENSEKNEEKDDKGENVQDKQFNSKIEYLQKQNADIIKQIQDLKTSSNYSPMDYIDNLFKNFYWNKQDFIKWQKRNSHWK